MKTSRLLAALLAVSLCAVVAAAGASASPIAAKKVSIDVKSKSQKDILKNGVELVLKGKKSKKGKKPKKLTVELESSTFDEPDLDRLVKPEKVKLSKKGRAKVALKLSGSAKAEIQSCQPRKIRVSAGNAKAKFSLVRDTTGCKPQDIDMSRADECDFIGVQDSSLCMLPFPDDFYTVSDDTSETGRRINFQSSAMPDNEGGAHMQGSDYNANDGFSPGQTIVARIPGLDNPDALANTDPVGLADLGRFEDENAPIVVVDADTGERWPIWAEIDSNAATPEDTALLIHPATNFAAGHRYIVAMRNLKDADGNVLNAPEGFRYYRDNLPSSEPEINDQRDRFDDIFSTLRDAGIDRANLHLAWDFTVATDENIAKNILAMRNEAFADLGDSTMDDLVQQGDAPQFTVTSVQNYEKTNITPLPEDADMARRVQGTFEVPCYMTDPDGPGGTPACGPGSRLNLDSGGVPQQNGTWTANFNCMIPHSTVEDDVEGPARPTIYGHGLLGSANEGTSGPQKTLGNTHNIMDCATDEIGMAGTDVPNTIGILQNMADFPELADRLQQGLLNGLYLGRLLSSDDGFVTDPAFRQDDTDAAPFDPGNAPVIDTSRLYYNGNSQGAIFGGALVAVAPDLTRGSLGVGAMNYSVLLNRSVDFDTYATFLNPAYPSRLEQALLLSTIQMLWDRGESNGYAHRVTDNPLPETPAHELIMNIGLGDHQVTNFQAEVMARTMGTAKIHTPIVYDGRWPGVDAGWDLDAMTFPQTSGSALVYWDPGPIRDDPGSANPDDVLGTNVPPILNVPNRDGDDPHENPRRTPEEQQMVSDFLQPNAQSQITDTCLGAPCFDYLFAGP